MSEIAKVNSKLGIVSCALGVLSIAFAFWCIWAFKNQIGGQWEYQYGEKQAMTRLITFFAIGFGSVGLGSVFGLIGTLKKNVIKKFSVIGLSVNVLSGLLILLLIALNMK